MKGFNNYTEREEFSIFKKFFLDHGRCKEMKKKEYFAEQGIVTTHGRLCRERYVPLCLYGWKRMWTHCRLCFRRRICRCYPQCIKKEKAIVSIQATTDSLIYYASAQEITNFFSTDKSTQELEKILAEELFVQTYKRLLDIYCKTPTELYVDLVRRYPDFLNYITLREIASFLRVTPETISHIRKNTKGIEFC